MELEQLLSQKGLVFESPNHQEVLDRARQVAPRAITLFYGETYDHAGNTIDSMKYYFFIANLSDTLREAGFTTDPTILVADTAACRNVNSSLEYKYMKLGEARANFIERINDIYSTGLRIVRMSEYINSETFQSKLKEIIRICQSDSALMQMVEGSVPESKIEIEREKGFMYSFDEITTIADLDLKVGPPREDLYDKIAREIAQRRETLPIISIFLTPTFPQGKGWEYFFLNEGIEDHGITAYKGGSKRLQDFRILVGRTSPEYANELLKNSFISQNPELPNPVLDVGLIIEMARQRLERNVRPVELHRRFYSGEISPEKLKEIVAHDLNEDILSKF